MSNKHQIKNIFLIHNLINGIKQKGFASRATHLYWRDIDSTIRYSKKFKPYTHLFKQYSISINTISKLKQQCLKVGESGNLC